MGLVSGSAVFRGRSAGVASAPLAPDRSKSVRPRAAAAGRGRIRNCWSGDQAPRRSASQVPEQSPPRQVPAPRVAFSRPEPVALWLPRLTVTFTCAGADHAAIDVDGARTLVEQRAAGDADRIAVGAVAGALLGDDHDAPETVEIGGGGRRGGEPGKGRQRQRQHAGDGEIAEEFLGFSHEPHPVFMPV